MYKEMKEIIRKGINKLLKTGEADSTNWKEFFLLIISYLSFNRKMDLVKVRRISMDLSNLYNEAMISFDRTLGNSFDILKLLEHPERRILSFTSIKKDKRISINCLISEIKDLKDVYAKRSKSNIKTAKVVS